jgi:hypothetical protein
MTCLVRGTRSADSCGRFFITGSPHADFKVSSVFHTCKYQYINVTGTLTKARTHKHKYTVSGIAIYI